MKDVEIETVNDKEADFGTDISIQFQVQGGRSPNSVKLSHSNHPNLIDWPADSAACTGKYKLTCTKVITSLDYTYDGSYTITAKNEARTEVTKSDTFTTTVYKDVSTKINPSK